MASFRFRLPVLIALLPLLQNIHGQQFGNLINNPKVGQSFNQGFPNNTPLKSINDNLLQNDLGKPSNLNTSGQQQTFISQSPQILPATFSLQQMQNIPQNMQSNLQQSLQQSIPQSFPQSLPQGLPQSVTQNVPQSLSQNFAQNLPQFINQQTTHLADLQQPSILYPSVNIPQSSFIQQPILQDTSNVYIPVLQTTSLQPISSQPLNGNANFQIPLSSLTQQIPVLSQTLPITNSFGYPTTATVPSCGYQLSDFVPNLGSNYAGAISTVPIMMPEAQFFSSLPNLPYQAVIPSTNPTVIGQSIFNPYQNQIFKLDESPLEIQNDMALDDETFESDNLTSLLLSLLQTSNKSPQTFPQNPYTPYNPYCCNKGSKSSHLKALLPVILNLIKERRATHACRDQCNVCNQKNKSRKDLKPQISGGYSKKKDYSFRDEMFSDHGSDEDSPRIVREHKKYKKIKNSMPLSSTESFENDSDELSDEHDN